ncbi:MAG: magnesium transporter CorA family protein [Clostridiales bacterium]|nr:magnesium transporter CorA family protein [Clostridiales bacterium]
MIQVITADEKKRLSQVPADTITADFDFTDKWIHLANPDDREIEFISRALSVPENMLKAALDEEERARADKDDGVTLIVADMPKIEDEDDYYTYTTIPFGFIITEKAIITVSLDEETTIVNDFFYGRVKDFSIKKRTRFVLHFLYRISTKFLQYLTQIDKASHRIQAELEKSMRNKELIELLDLEKSLVYFSNSLRANRILLDRLPKLAHFFEEDADLLDDVIIETNQAIDTSNLYLEILSGTMDAYASIISNNLNIVMKVMTVITIMISIPSMVAAFWGMNTGVPFQGKLYGFWIAIGISLVLCIITGIIMFKKKFLK